MAANIHKLVADGHLDLDSLLEGKWDTVRVVATYNGDRNEEEPHEVCLQIAISHGITAYRWVDFVGCDYYDRGGPMLNRAECVREAKAHAASEHREVGK